MESPVKSLRDVALLIGTVLLSLSAGAIGSFATAANVAGWYQTITRPWFTPPDWVFGPAWTTLYILMGISIFLILKVGWERRDVRVATGIFALQLFVNAIWSFLFFGIPSPLLGLICIVILWFLILWMIIAFYRIRPVAAYLNIPYIAWVSFATLLNASIYLLNP
ncbi:MAG: tryptophan-rich sensory protein [Methanocalculus sp. MSAO_Arc1]|uniref:TspO/MBR family protein n=1 Tax=Methanocalculus TaxID=71151 RepID=UPI000FF0BB9B|nr:MULTISPECIES: TspO/MBR family protein [unclassified Methanocalculus]MCP1662105.1 tryptophan-rich sensory protein [Methanocalculus sp. AMF5]RQD80172.1 MAG: tryptophan-rich sensory protein [Methanocalculus sp. MSAO_Arc1]